MEMMGVQSPEEFDSVSERKLLFFYPRKATAMVVFYTLLLKPLVIREMECSHPL